jgi:hypothetical protein
MKRLYENAKKVQVWLGADTEEHKTATTVDAVQKISEFLCEKLDISIDHHVVGLIPTRSYFSRRALSSPCPMSST